AMTVASTAAGRAEDVRPAASGMSSILPRSAVTSPQGMIPAAHPPSMRSMTPHARHRSSAALALLLLLGVMTAFAACGQAETASPPSIPGGAVWVDDPF